MDTISLMNNTIEYIEANLCSELKIDDIAKVACSSRYHFQRVFYALTGFTVTKYIKNRRLTLAAEELSITQKRVTDIALKYCYESPEAFTKAFKRLHGIAPSDIKKPYEKIKAFPKLYFEVSIKGKSEFLYKIVERVAFKVFGAEFITTKTDDAAYKEIPKFIIDSFKNGTHARINTLLDNPKGTLLEGFHYGFEEDGTRKYIMGAELSEADIGDEFTILEVPRLTWAVFEGKGDKPNNDILQDIWRRIYSEWFPSSEFEQAEGPCIEKNFWDEEKQEEYSCQLWIPVKRK